MISEVNMAGIKGMKKRSEPVKSRFENSISAIPDTGCWIWTKAWFDYGLKGGYGSIKVKGKSVHAHRLAWEIYNGSIPDGLFVLHKCDTKCCCNPKHLFLGNNMDNMLDAAKKGFVWGTGEKNFNAKLSAEDVKNILNDNRPQTHIAKDYPITQAQISDIKNRKSWKCLHDL